MNRKQLTGLSLVTAIFAIAVLLSQIDSGNDRQRLFPDLTDRINEVTRLRIEKAGSEPITVERREDGWRVAEKSAYLANMGSLRRELLKLARLELIEARTRKPENHAKLGLRDPNEAGSTATQVSIWLEKTDEPLVVLVGKTASGGGSYVRKAGEAQTWLASQRVDLPVRIADWLDREVLSLDRKRVRLISIVRGDDKLTIERAAPTAEHFQVTDLKSAENVKVAQVDGMADAFGRLSLDDVRPKAELTLGGRPRWTATLQTFDGLQVVMEIHLSGDKTYARLKASKIDPGVDQDAESREPLLSPEAVAAEIERLNARWSGWAYVLPDYRLKSIGKKKAELLQKAG